MSDKTQLYKIATDNGMWQDDKGIWHATDHALDKFASFLCSSQNLYIGQQLKKVAEALIEKGG